MTALLLLALACSPKDPVETGADPTSTDPTDTEDTDTDTPPDTEDTADTEDTDPELWDVPYDPACNPLSMHDDCLTPYPSMWHTVDDGGSPTGLRIGWTAEQFSSPDGAIPVDPEIVHGADGFSAVTPILVALGRDVDASFLSGWGAQGDTTVPGAAIALVDLATGEPVPVLTEMDQSNRELTDYEGRWSLIIRPLAPMSFGGRYAVVLTDALRDPAGAEFTSPPVFEALRDGILTSSDDVEAMRPAYDAMFTTLEAAGWARDDLLVAWELPVASEDFVLGPIRDMREIALTHIAKHGVAYTIDEVQVDPSDDVAYLLKGTFSPPSFLTADNTLARDADGHVVLQPEDDWPSYPFTAVIPPVARDEGALGLSLFGHGLFGNGDGFLDSSSARTYIHPVGAETGAVQIATDWIGLSSGDFNLIVEEVLGDLGRVTVVTDRLVQSHVNNLALVELAFGDLSTDPAIARNTDAALLDPDRVVYYGISLGGIQGAGQVSISPRIRAGVLAVPGAGWSHMIQRSTQFSELDLIIDLLYPDPLTQQVFIAAVQTFFDHSDPANLATLLNDDPTNPGAPVKTVVLQEAIGDCQVPNIATDLLARTFGAPHLEIATDPVWGLDTVPGPVTGSAVLTQIRVPWDLKAYFPPDDNTLPALDNGVHNSAVLQPAAFDQADHLFLTGEVIHPCDGTCDPD